jgi:hypothetical protein
LNIRRVSGTESDNLSILSGNKVGRNTEGKVAMRSMNLGGVGRPPSDYGHKS